VAPAERGSLTLVGTGIQLAAHLTVEVRDAIERADVVLCLVADPATHASIARMNPRTRSLLGHYESGRPRVRAYAAMSDEILRHVRAGLQVCVAAYGHPSVFVTPSRDALRSAREEGYPTRVLPGISAEDCLLADLDVDPAENGCQSYDATRFVLNGCRPNRSAALILWQIGTVGDDRASAEVQPTGLPRLVERLLETYPRDHVVTVYEASPYPGFRPLIRRVRLAELDAGDVTALSTLYVPPACPNEPNAALIEEFNRSVRP